MEEHPYGLTPRELENLDYTLHLISLGKISRLQASTLVRTDISKKVCLNKERRIFSKNSFCEACVNYRETFDQRQIEYNAEVMQKMEMMAFDVQKFTKENFMQALQSLPNWILSCQSTLFKVIKIDLEIIERQGRYFIQVKTNDKFFPVSTCRCLAIFYIIPLLAFSLFIESSKYQHNLFSKVMFGYANLIMLNQYKWALNQMLYTAFSKDSYQTTNLPLHEDLVLYQRIQQRKHFKANKNAYPCLFKWILKILREKFGNQQNQTSIRSDVITLTIHRQSMIEEISSLEYEKEREELKSLSFKDFKALVESHYNLCSRLSVVKEKLSCAGIDQDLIGKYSKEYSKNTSFKRVHQLTDEKQIYFWIILMAVVLEQLPLEGSQLQNSAFMHWILQNPDMGFELKMNLLSLEMRKFYSQKITEAQNALVRKLEKKRKKGSSKQTLPIIEENSKRLSSYDLKEQKLRPIQKVKVSERSVLKEIPVSQENDKSVSRKQRNEMSRQYSVRRYTRQIFELQRWALSDFIRRYECCRQFINFPDFISGFHSLKPNLPHSFKK